MFPVDITRNYPKKLTFVPLRGQSKQIQVNVPPIENRTGKCVNCGKTLSGNIAEQEQLLCDSCYQTTDICDICTERTDLSQVIFYNTVPWSCMAKNLLPPECRNSTALKCCQSCSGHMKQTISVMWQVCRFCERKSVLADLFHSNNNEIREMLCDQLGMPISFDDGLPRYICTYCKINFRRVQIFYDTIKNTEKKLLKIQEVQMSVDIHPEVLPSENKVDQNQSKVLRGVVNSALQGSDDSNEVSKTTTNQKNKQILIKGINTRESGTSSMVKIYESKEITVKKGSQISSAPAQPQSQQPIKEPNIHTTRTIRVPQKQKESIKSSKLESNKVDDKSIRTITSASTSVMGKSPTKVNNLKRPLLIDLGAVPSKRIQTQPAPKIKNKDIPSNFKTEQTFSAKYDSFITFTSDKVNCQQFLRSNMAEPIDPPEDINTSGDVSRKSKEKSYPQSLEFCIDPSMFPTPSMLMEQLREVMTTKTDLLTLCPRTGHFLPVSQDLNPDAHAQPETSLKSPLTNGQIVPLSQTRDLKQTQNETDQSRKSKNNMTQSTHKTVIPVSYRSQNCSLPVQMTEDITNNPSTGNFKSSSPNLQAIQMKTTDVLDHATDKQINLSHLKHLPQIKHANNNKSSSGILQVFSKERQHIVSKPTHAPGNMNVPSKCNNANSDKPTSGILTCSPYKTAQTIAQKSNNIQINKPCTEPLLQLTKSTGGATANSPKTYVRMLKNPQVINQLKKSPSSTVLPTSLNILYKKTSTSATDPSSRTVGIANTTVSSSSSQLESLPQKSQASNGYQQASNFKQTPIAVHMSNTSHLKLGQIVANIKTKSSPSVNSSKIMALKKIDPAEKLNKSPSADPKTTLSHLNISGGVAKKHRFIKLCDTEGTAPSKLSKRRKTFAFEDKSQVKSSPSLGNDKYKANIEQNKNTLLAESLNRVKFEDPIQSPFKTEYIVCEITDLTQDDNDDIKSGGELSDSEVTVRNSKGIAESVKTRRYSVTNLIDTRKSNKSKNSQQSSRDVFVPNWECVQTRSKAALSKKSKSQNTELQTKSRKRKL